MILIFATDAIITYCHGNVAPEELRTNPFVMLGYIRGAFAGTSGFLGVTFTLFKSDQLVEIIQKLNILQNDIKFNAKQLKIMLCVLILQLFLCYSYCATTIFVGFSEKTENLILRALVAIGTSIVSTPMLVIEMFFISAVGLLGEYFKMVNNKLAALDCPTKTHPIIW